MIKPDAIGLSLKDSNFDREITLTNLERHDTGIPCEKGGRNRLHHITVTWTNKQSLGMYLVLFGGKIRFSDPKFEGKFWILRPIVNLKN